MKNRTLEKVIKKTKEDYCVYVNREELIEPAIRNGFSDVVLYTGDELNDSVIELARKLDKPVVGIVYDRKQERFIDSLDVWQQNDRWHVIVPIYGMLKAEGTEEQARKDGNRYILKRVTTIETAIENFPTKNELERVLRRHSVIKVKDFTDICGNCDKPLGENDKYCRYCGTPKGEGKFEPFYNRVLMAYAPPIKKKYKCTQCGYTWISKAFGGDHAEYCPRCGSPISVIEESDLMMWGDFRSGLEEPYDETDKPLLLNESEVKELLDHRNSAEDKESFDIIDLLKRNGEIDVEHYIKHHYLRTEKEQSQYDLSELILTLEGNDLYACDNAVCPHCGSNMAAAIDYEIDYGYSNTLLHSAHIAVPKDALLLHKYRNIYYSEPKYFDKDWPVYKCLSCGTEYTPEDQSTKENGITITIQP